MSLSVAPPPRSAVASTVTPVLRAVLLADLADSTAFVQRFGDARAATILQRMDLKIRDLLEFTGGRLIDKADGLLAIFERPIQAVDFGLRYQQALRQLGMEEGVPLAARVGIHVGELMTWQNSEQDVRAGAKPMEVEGLAKPVAARLMALALPGQILVSSMAQALAQRAQSELGERAERVKWLSHGRYRFKGVPAPILVHEVGEVGASPLKQPPSGHKVWRELPLWRRPPVLAAELLVMLGVVGFFGWTALRSPPALAFQQRDWVVVGDLNNFTGDARLNDALDTALRIELEQSRYVNVVPELKVREALRRMGRNDLATIDRAVGSEIALREGARALLLPSVAEVGGRLRISVEVVDPDTLTTVFAQSAEGRGAESALASMDSVAGELRGELGESIASIKASDKPLAEATTGSLDALRAYALADAAYYAGHDQDALGLFDKALELDPEFAMAKLGKARVLARGGRFAQARTLLADAAARRDRLSEREALQMDAFAARFESNASAMGKFKVWAAMYPDAFAAYVGYSQAAMEEGQYASGLAFLGPALTPRNPRQANARYLQGVLLLALNRYPEAKTAFQQADSMGVNGDKLEIAELHAAQRDFAGVRDVLRTQMAGGVAGKDLRLQLDDHLFLLDQGQWAAGVKSVSELQSRAQVDNPDMAMALEGTRLALAGYDGSLRREQWIAMAEQQTRRIHSSDPLQRRQAAFPLSVAAWLAARNGDVDTARAALAQVRKDPATKDDRVVAGMLQIVEAEMLMAAGDDAAAIAKLLPAHDGNELYFSHAVLLRAYLHAKDYAAASKEAEWLALERGRAYAEWNSWDSWNAPNVVESNLAVLTLAEIALANGQTQAAASRLAQFLSAWPGAERGFAGARVRALEQALAKPRA